MTLTSLTCRSMIPAWLTCSSYDPAIVNLLAIYDINRWYWILVKISISEQTFPRAREPRAKHPVRCCSSALLCLGHACIVREIPPCIFFFCRWLVQEGFVVDNGAMSTALCCAHQVRSAVLEMTLLLWITWSTWVCHCILFRWNCSVSTVANQINLTIAALVSHVLL